MRTSCGRIVKPARCQDFDYSYMLTCAHLLRPSSSSSPLEAHLHSRPSSSSSLEARLQSLVSHRSSLKAQDLSLISSVLPCLLCPLPLCINDSPEVFPVLQKNKFRRKQRARAKRLGESVQWLLKPDSLERMAIMSKPSGSFFYLDLKRRDWIAAYDETALTYIEQRGNPSRRPEICCALNKAQVELLRRADKFFGHAEGVNESPCYGFTEQWQKLLAARAQQRLPPLPFRTPRRRSPVACRSVARPTVARPSPARLIPLSAFQPQPPRMCQTMPPPFSPCRIRLAHTIVPSPAAF